MVFYPQTAIDMLYLALSQSWVLCPIFFSHKHKFPIYANLRGKRWRKRPLRAVIKSNTKACYKLVNEIMSCSLQYVQGKLQTKFRNTKWDDKLAAAVFLLFFFFVWEKQFFNEKLEAQLNIFSHKFKKKPYHFETSAGQLFLLSFPLLNFKYCIGTICSVRFP